MFLNDEVFFTASASASAPAMPQHSNLQGEAEEAIAIPHPGTS